VKLRILFEKNLARNLRNKKSFMFNRPILRKKKNGTALTKAHPQTAGHGFDLQYL